MRKAPAALLPEPSTAHVPATSAQAFAVTSAKRPVYLGDLDDRTLADFVDAWLDRARPERDVALWVTGAGVLAIPLVPVNLLLGAVLGVTGLAVFCAYSKLASEHGFRLRARELGLQRRMRRELGARALASFRNHRLIGRPREEKHAKLLADLRTARDVAAERRGRVTPPTSPSTSASS